MSDKTSRSKAVRQKSKKRSREYSDLTLILIVLLVLAVAIVGGYVIKSRQAARVSPTAAVMNYKQYSAAPPMTIDPAKQYLATVKMAKGGEFVIQLYPDKAPVTVNSFVFLAREGYFDGVTFHRVLAGFMAQPATPRAPAAAARDTSLKMKTATWCLIRRVWWLWQTPGEIPMAASFLSPMPRLST